MTDKPTDKPADKPEETKPEEAAPIETHHDIKIGRKTLKYTVTTGMMPLKNADSGETEANIFFMAYTLEQGKDAPKRPLTFVFNGGPGSASVWLHLGALGPKRVKMQDEGWLPMPPFQLVDNEHTWLDFTDLVFVDPVGTGYSRAVKAENNKKYWSLQSDLESTGQFICLYLTRYERWTSPLFLAGESYGTTRAAGLAGTLYDKGVAFNGIFLISTVLNFQTLMFDRGNDLPYSVYVGTYAATAWYHKRLPADLQNKPLTDVLAEAEAWAENEYTPALMRGDGLSAAERTRIIKRLARYTGMSTTFIEQSNLRIHIRRFCKELLRDQQVTVGRLDSRFKGHDTLPISEFPDFDPAMTDIVPPYTAMMHDYVRGELGYKTDSHYEVLNRKVNESWEWDRRRYADTSELLRSAIAKNPFMKVFIGQGYYDLATPHVAARYNINHMDIHPARRDNLHTYYYEAGHMMYLDIASLTKLKTDVNEFLKLVNPS